MVQRHSTTPVVLFEQGFSYFYDSSYFSTSKAYLTGQNIACFSPKKIVVALAFAFSYCTLHLNRVNGDINCFSHILL